MTALVVSRPTIQRQGGMCSVSADFLIDGNDLLGSVGFRFPCKGDFELPGGEAFAALAVVPALKLGLDVRSEAPLVRGYPERLRLLQEIWLNLTDTNASPVKIDAPERAPIKNRNRGSIVFYSGGVDSFHAIHAHRSENPTLLFIEGFDIPLARARHRADVRDRMAAAATRLELPFLPVQTNARVFLEQFASYAHSGIWIHTAIAHLLSSSFGRFVLGGSHKWNHPYTRLDNYLFTSQLGSADVEILVDGMSRNRVEKLTALADKPVALDNLRICWLMPESAMNCGRCVKCLYAMTCALEAGLLGRIATLPSAVDWSRLAEAGFDPPELVIYWRRLLDQAKNPEILEKLTPLVEAAEADVFARKLWAGGPELSTTRAWPLLARKLGKPALAAIAEDDPAWLHKMAARHIREFRADLYDAIRPRLPWRNWFSKKRCQTNGQDR